jgi:Holliday junction resolvase RusA-like endonuclease
VSDRIISFFVPGKPQPAGSKRAFIVNRKIDHKPIAVVSDANPKSKDWKIDVKHFAAEEYSGPLLTGPLLLELTFYLVRPEFHRNQSGLTKSAPRHPISKPDLLKLTRGVEDALTGMIWRDDAQIVDHILRKRYVKGPFQQQGVMVEIGVV